MTTTRTTAARDLLADMIINYRGIARVLLSDATLDLDDDGNVWAYAVLVPVDGQPLNLSLLADEPVEHL